MADNERRRLLKTLGTLGTAGLAGCTSSEPMDTETPVPTEPPTTERPTTEEPTPTETETTDTPAQEYIDVQRWTSPGDFDPGQFRGTKSTNGGAALTIADPIGEREYADPHGDETKTWEYSRWISPMQSVDFGAKQLVASWVADAPQGTWLEVGMRGETTSGDSTGWYVMGRWAATNAAIHRTSVLGQDDEYGRIAIDTFEAANGVALGAYQLRVTLYQLPGSEASPVLRSVTASTSRLPRQEHVEASTVGDAAGTTLDVPQYSQMIHEGEYAQWGGGGEAWCSPTSTAMVVSYWGREPSEEQLSWVDSDYQDPQVDFAARGTYDHSYGGTGNWPFNVAYAGRFGLDGFVTRLGSLDELEQYVEAGIPIVTSQSFEEHELPGAGYGTSGHLLVVVGFTEDGDVVANDPYAATNEDVRVVYPRTAFENVWQRTSGTGGIAYVIYPPGHELPDVWSGT